MKNIERVDLKENWFFIFMAEEFSLDSALSLGKNAILCVCALGAFARLREEHWKRWKCFCYHVLNTIFLIPLSDDLWRSRSFPQIVKCSRSRLLGMYEQGCKFKFETFSVEIHATNIRLCRWEHCSVTRSFPLPMPCPIKSELQVS